MNYNDTKLIVYLQTFSKKELTEFEKFIESPYFRQGRDVTPLFKVLIKFHPEYLLEDFNEKIVYEKIYPGSKFGDKKSKDMLKTLSSSLLKMAEEFMVISNLRKNKILMNKTILEELLDRGLFKYYEKYSQTAEEGLNVKGELSAQTVIEKYSLGGINTRYYTAILDHKKYLIQAFKSGEYLSEYFLINLLRLAKLKFFSETGSNIPLAKDITDLILADVDIEKILNESKDSPHYVLTGFHYYSYLSLIKKCDLKYYKKAKDIFFENKSGLSRMEKFYLYADLLNIQNLAYQFADYAYSREEIFKLLNACVKDGAYKLSKEAYMQPGFYRNFILNAIYFKEFELADKFINDYSEELKPAFRKNMKFYSRALIEYGKGEFEEALVNISKVKYDLVNFKVDVKLLSLKIFYELQLTEQAYSMIDTFKHYLKSYTEIPDELKESYFYFIKCYVRLLNIKEKEDVVEAKFLIKEVEKEKNIAQKNWLIEKLNAF